MRHHTYTNIKGFATVLDSKSGGDFASALERDRFTSLVPLPEIHSVELQRPQINYVGISGDTTRYTGDMLVTFKITSRRRPLVIETKYSEDLNPLPKDGPSVLKKKAELNKKHDLLRSVFAARGMDFEVHTEAEVYTEKTRMQRFVFGFINNPFDEREADILNKMSEVSRSNRHRYEFHPKG